MSLARAWHGASCALTKHAYLATQMVAAPTTASPTRAVAATATRRPRAALIALLVIGSVALAGCGGGSSGSASGTAASATVVTKAQSGYGTVLATPSGRDLFVLTSDAAGTTCSGSCTKEWHPLIASGKVTAGPGLNASLLSTVRRSDGRTQVTYDKRPLYTYAGSDTTGAAGVMGDGGIWYLIAPSGKPVEQTTSGGY